MKYSLTLFAAASLLSFISCTERESGVSGSAGKPLIVVSVPPYAGLVEKVGGDLFGVLTLVTENDDPHTYSVTPNELVKVSGAKVYFTASLPFEKTLVSKLSETKGGPALVDLLAGLETRNFSEGEHEHHDHAEGEHDHAEHKEDADHDHAEHDHEDAEHKKHADHDHDHEESELDPHVWLSPVNLIIQAELISSALQGLVSSEDEKATIRSNTAALVADLTAVDKELAITLSPLRGESFFVYHGAFGYFARDYSLKQEAIEINGRSPEPKQLTDVVAKAKAEDVHVVFVQPQFDQTSAEALAEAINGKVVAIDPLAKDVIANLRDIAAKLKAQ
jgi:zinc transport system substrate-binding protein